MVFFALLSVHLYWNCMTRLTLVVIAGDSYLLDTDSMIWSRLAIPTSPRFVLMFCVVLHCDTL